MAGALEKTKTNASVVTTQKSDTVPNEKPDIEHAEVVDDPRKWSTARKVNIASRPTLRVSNDGVDCYPSNDFRCSHRRRSRRKSLQS